MTLVKALSLAGVLWPARAGADPNPATSPQLQPTPGPYFVGQAIDVRVRVAGPERPVVGPIRLEGAEVIRLDRPSEGAAFRLVPRRAGALAIPAISVRWGSRIDHSQPLRLPIRPLPATGRSAEFLGGVGLLNVKAQAEPSTLVLGQPSEFRLTIDGPGALGSTARPRLAGRALTSLAIQVEPLPDEFRPEPPRRIFRWRLRPGAPGQAILPTVGVAFFDPNTQHYFTTATRGISLRVDDLPRFTAEAVRYAPPPVQTPARLAIAGAWAIGILGGGGIAWAIFEVLRKRRSRRDHQARRVARRLASGCHADLGAPTLARWVGEALGEYLTRARGWPGGALTPTEAEFGVLEVSANVELARHAARLIESCDRIRYAEGHSSAETLASQARQVFEALAGVDRAGGEALRTANQSSGRRGASQIVGSEGGDKERDGGESQRPQAATDRLPAVLKSS